MRDRLLAAVGLAAAVLYLAGLRLDLATLRLVSKPIPVLCLALRVGLEDSGAYARLLAAGLALSLLGDVLLELPGSFLAGLGAFLGAHLAYAAAFLARERRLLVARAVPSAAFGLAAWAFLRPGLGEMAVPVAVYVAAICTMMWRAAAVVAPGRPGAGSALAGALLFAASDTLIALDRFHGEIAGVGYPIMLLYWAGQAGIALSARRPQS